MKKKEDQAEILLQISNEIACIRDKNDMLQLIQQTLKKYLHFRDSHILKYNKKNRTCRPYIYQLLEEQSLTTEQKAFFDSEYAVADDNTEEYLDPIVYNVASLMPAGSTQIDFMHNSGIKEFVVIKLIERKELIGLHVLLSDRVNSFSSGDLDVLKKISHQIAMATSNLIAREEITKAETEKTTLLSLTAKIAMVRNKNELLELLNEQLTKLFPIVGFGITLINPDGRTHSPFVVDVQGNLKQSDDFEKAVSQIYSITDGVYDVIIEADGPVTLNVNALANSPQAPAYVKFWNTMLVPEVVGIPVRAGSNKLGCFILLSEPDTAKTINNTLLKGLGAQVSVAISHIIANEEIAKKEEEKTILLSLSNEISSLKNRTDLYKVVNERIKKLFSITEFSIAKIDENRKTYSAFMLDLEDYIKTDVNFQKTISSGYNVTDGLFATVINSADPIIFEVDKIVNNPTMPAFVHFWKKVGLTRVLCAALKTGGRSVGMVVLHIDNNNFIDPKSILLKGICSQLSVAISNILAIEEIERRENEREQLLVANKVAYDEIKLREIEKSRLLEFSIAMASSRDRRILGKILTHHLREVLGVKQYYMLYVLSSDKKAYYPFLYDPDFSPSNLSADPNFERLIKSDNLVSESIMERILELDEPLLFKIEERFKKPMTPTYAKMMEERGISKITGAPIKLGEEKIGVILFDTQNEPLGLREPLCRSICSQLAISVSNLIADAEIQGREKEKTMLLEFSNAMVSVRDKNVLAKILNRHLRNLFGIKNYVIHALSDDKKTLRPILLDPETDFAKHTDYNKLTDQPTAANDGVFEKILNSEDPVIFNVADWFHSSTPPMYAKLARDTGLTNIAGIRIRVGNENIAVMNFSQNELYQPVIDAPLFKSVCSQLAITVANIIANEKVSDQLYEINKYKQQLEEEKIYLKEEIATTQNFSELIGESEEMKKVFRLVRQVSSSDSTVLLLGETGTGKELIARAIHNGSPRKNKLMVKVNCAAIPPSLIESELFGHERGSFTGATERRIGKFELAHQGTLFLDEIGEMPLEMQVKLLRALQEREIERVGGRVTIKVDARIIAATNRDLEKLMEEGRFRSDLYYRLNIFPIDLPPLRNRRDDIPILALHFVKRFAKMAGKDVHSFSNKAIQDLINYSWPGNIRELEHLIERTVLLSPSAMIKEIQLPASHKQTYGSKNTDDIPVKTIDEIEREYILKVLKHVKGRVSGEGGAAELLGIPPSTLNSRMKRLAIRKEHFG